MSSRFLVPVLCIGAVAYACGPRTRNEANAPKRNSSLAQVASKNAPAPRKSARKVAKSETATVGAKLYVHAGESSIRLALHVVNSGTKRVEITFPSGQTYDFVILDSLGREMWHWGSGRMFTQTLRNKLLDGGEALDIEETWVTAALAPGRYTARGVLTSVNFPLTQQTEFTVEATIIAQRND
jgi:hypothetical protein